MPERVLRQPVQGGSDGRVAAAPTGKPAMPVVSFGDTVHAYPDPDAELSK